MHFRHISAKIQPKNLKQHIDWGAGLLDPPGYALVTVSSPEITLILQPACSDVKISPARAHGNRLKVDLNLYFFSFNISISIIKKAN